MLSTGPDAAKLFEEDLYGSQETDQAPALDMSQAMWLYRNQRQFNGVPVSQDAQDLAVDNIQDVQRALKLVYVTSVWTGYLSPQEADKKFVQEYATLKQQQAQGSVVIYNQDKQFCPTMGKFLVVLTYANVTYGLKQRFSYLKKETTND